LSRAWVKVRRQKIKINRSIFAFFRQNHKMEQMGQDGERVKEPKRIRRGSLNRLN